VQILKFLDALNCYTLPLLYFSSLKIVC